MRLKRAGFLTKLVIVVLLVYLATSLLDLRGQIQSVQAGAGDAGTAGGGTAAGQPAAGRRHRKQRRP